MMHEHRNLGYLFIGKILCLPIELIKNPVSFQDSFDINGVFQQSLSEFHCKFEIDIPHLGGGVNLTPYEKIKTTSSSPRSVRGLLKPSPPNKHH